MGEGGQGDVVVVVRRVPSAATTTKATTTTTTTTAPAAATMMMCTEQPHPHPCNGILIRPCASVGLPTFVPQTKGEKYLNIHPRYLKACGLEELMAWIRKRNDGISDQDASSSGTRAIRWCATLVLVLVASRNVRPRRPDFYLYLSRYSLCSRLRTFARLCVRRAHYGGPGVFAWKPTRSCPADFEGCFLPLAPFCKQISKQQLEKETGTADADLLALVQRKHGNYGSGWWWCGGGGGGGRGGGGGGGNVCFLGERRFQ